MLKTEQLDGDFMYKDYINFNYILNKLQWENYIENQNCDLNEICSKIFDSIDDMRNNKEIVFSKRYIREWIEKSKEVSVLRNKLDDFDNYIDEEKITKEELAEKICPDVIRLMKLRDDKSIEIGFSSYMNAILKSDNMTYQMLIDLLNDYLDKNLERANQIIEKYNIRWETWFNDIESIGNSLNKTDKSIAVTIDAYKILYKFAEKMDMLEVLEKVKIYCEDSVCFATKVASDDIRINVGEIKSINDVRTLFHEFGHAILYYYSSKNTDDIYFDITPCLDEVFAVIIENIAPIVTLSENEVEKIDEINCLEYTRTAISGLFELELWNDSSLAEKLYTKYYYKLSIEIENPKLWCLDSFRSIDCMYIYNYTLGQIASEHFKDLFYKMCFEERHRYNGKYEAFSNTLKKICSNINEINYIDLLNFEK